MFTYIGNAILYGYQMFAIANPIGKQEPTYFFLISIFSISNNFLRLQKYLRILFSFRFYFNHE